MNPQQQLMLQQAIQDFQGGNFDNAALILKNLLNADSENLPALHILGLIHASQKNTERQQIIWLGLHACTLKMLQSNTT